MTCLCLAQFVFPLNVKSHKLIVIVSSLSSQKLKKAKQHAAQQKIPSSKKAPSNVGGGGGGANMATTPLTASAALLSSDINPPPAKKLKKNEPKNIFQTTRPSSDPVTASQNNGDLSLLSAVNVSMKLLKATETGSGGSGGASAGNLTETGESLLGGTVSGSSTTTTQQVPKAPPVLPEKLPETVLTRVRNLEQVSIISSKFKKSRAA